MFGRKKPEKIDKTNSFMINEVLSGIRRQFSGILGESSDGERDIYNNFKYPKQVSFQSCYWLARRNGIANRIVFGLARSSWRNGFSLKYNGEKVESAELAQIKARFTQAIERADILNRMGRFSVLLVGVPDGLELSKPIGTFSKSQIGDVYFQPYSYDGIEIASYESDPTNPRFQLPKTYQLTIRQRGTSKDINTKVLIVHWSRLIHICENSLDSDIEGMAALEPVYNRILDWEKVVGGTSEGVYQNANTPISLEIDPEFASNATKDQREALEEEADKWTNRFKKFIKLAGTKAKAIIVPIHDPTGQANTLIKEISAYTGIPARVLTGEGAGQLAGAEDRLAYNTIVREREEFFCSPLISRFIEIMTACGVFDFEYDKIDWNEAESATEKEKAEVQEIKSKTVKNISDAVKPMSGLDGVVDPQELLNALGFDIQQDLDE